MSDPAPPDQQHAHQGQGDAKGAVVTIELAEGEDVAQPIAEAGAFQQPAEDLQTAMGGELLLGKDDRKVGLGTASN